MPSSMNVGVLGATGTVGQRFIVLLAAHPFFVIHALGASARSAGKPYAKAATWKQPVPIPAAVREMSVNECDPKHFADCSVVFSGLDAEVAGDIGTWRSCDSENELIFSLQRLHSGLRTLRCSRTQRTSAETRSCP